MKRCPACQAIYNDDMILKCTNCGADLIEENQQSSYYEQPVQNNIPPQNNHTNYNTYNTPQFKYCTHCGNQCDPKAVICVKCGMQFTDMYPNKPRVEDKPSGGLKFLCFLIPVIGLILYLVNMNDKPVSAKAYGKSALIGFIIGIILYGILFAITFLSYLFMFSTDSFVTDAFNNNSEFFYSIIGNLL